MKSPQERDIRVLLDSTFDQAEVEAIVDQYKAKPYDEDIVSYNLGTLVNLVDFPQMEKIKPNLLRGSLYIDEESGLILAAGAHHALDPAKIYVEGAQELELRVSFSRGRPQFEYRMKSEGFLPAEVKANLDESLERSNNFDPAS